MNNNENETLNVNLSLLLEYFINKHKLLFVLTLVIYNLWKFVKLFYINKS